MDQMVSTSLCGLALSKAAIAIGALHTILFGVIFLLEYAFVFLDWMVLFHPPGLFSVFTNALLLGMLGSGAFFGVMAGVSLVVGALKAEPGLVLAWLLHQAVLVFSSFWTLFYFLVAAYLKAPLLDTIFELFLNAIQVYFFIVVYAHFLELRKGNLGENQLVC